MAALTRLLLIPAALLLWSNTAFPKDITGLPKALFGIFAKDTEACMAYYKIKAGKVKRPDKMPDSYEFSKVDGKYFYSDCDGPECKSHVVSYQNNRYGYVVNTEEEGASFLATLRGKNKLRLSFPPKGFAIDLVRCQKNPFKNESPK